MCLSDEDVVGHRERPADSDSGDGKKNPEEVVRRGQSGGKEKDRGQKCMMKCEMLQEETEEQRISIAWCPRHVRLGNRGLSAGAVCVCV